MQLMVSPSSTFKSSFVNVDVETIETIMEHVTLTEEKCQCSERKGQRVEKSFTVKAIL